MIQNLTPATRYTYDQVAVGQTLTVPLLMNLDVSSAREATLIARVHAITMSGTGTAPELLLALAPVAPYRDGLPYVGADGPALVLTMFDGNVSIPTAGDSRQASQTDGLGGWVLLAMIVKQYGTTCTSFDITLSIDLVQKG